MSIPDIEQMDNDERTLYAQALLGQDADDFFSSDLGRYIIGMALQDEKAASSELREVDPTDAAKVSNLQIKANTPALAIQWLANAIEEGREALSQLEQMNDTEL